MANMKGPQAEKGRERCGWMWRISAQNAKGR